MAGRTEAPAGVRRRTKRVRWYTALRPSAGPCHEVSTSENFTWARLMASDDPKLSIPRFLGMVRSRFSAGAKGTRLRPS
ncbi:hypothetical protein BDA96_04G326600 [Sorghum bicolor]|uniref:Uncharacterized protein n=2 Tax=Sorghum bicolor TaxID=4558 RepID=A0A921R9M6_SORBI|nr:hypothetical protein BDA96_04G326600 [Sorghum bicolor]KXG31143.1 hypothetical protein SORBI_3004G305300 [Sorghum bicolor]